MSEKDKVDELNKTITRLMLENKNLRERIEELKVFLRQQAPAVDGLSLLGSLKALLKERDVAQERVDFFRKEIKSILKYLLSSDEDDDKKSNELRKRINHFLFKNPR